MTYDIHGTRTRHLVLVGEDQDPSRRGSKRLVARSDCTFTCHDDQTLDLCIKALKESDDHLRQRPEEQVLWDWQSTFVEPHPDGGGVVFLGVAWYDESFFDEHRDAYLGREHLNYFLGIGLDLAAIEVTHWKLVNNNPL